MNNMRLDHYPPEFYQVIEAVAEGQELSITFPTENVASRRRNLFYDFRVLLRRLAEEGKGEVPMGLEEVAVERSGATLRFYPRSISPVALDMRAMLKLKHAVKREDGSYAPASPAVPYSRLSATIAEMSEGFAPDSGGDEPIGPPATGVKQ